MFADGVFMMFVKTQTGNSTLTDVTEICVENYFYDRDKILETVARNFPNFKLCMYFVSI